MKRETGSLFCLGIMFYVMVVSVIGILLNGWVLSILWAWFIVPVFALPALTVIQAIGVSTVVSFLKTKSKTDTDKEFANKDWNEILIKGALETVFTPVFSLGIGWIIVQFM